MTHNWEHLSSHTIFRARVNTIRIGKTVAFNGILKNTGDRHWTNYELKASHSPLFHGLISPHKGGRRGLSLEYYGTVLCSKLIVVVSRACVRFLLSEYLLKGWNVWWKSVATWIPKMEKMNFSPKRPIQFSNFWKWCNNYCQSQKYKNFYCKITNSVQF